MAGRKAARLRRLFRLNLLGETRTGTARASSAMSDAGDDKSAQSVHVRGKNQKIQKKFRAPSSSKCGPKRACGLKGRNSKPPGWGSAFYCWAAAVKFFACIWLSSRATGGAMRPPIFPPQTIGDTPQQYLHRARMFRDAAMQLPDYVNSEPNWPRYALLMHAIELALKAYARHF